MNFKNWTPEHTKGLLLGIATIIVASLIVVGYLAFDLNISYKLSFSKFLHLKTYTAKVLSLAAIGNLPWFHFLSLKNQKWALGQGIILATIIDLIVILLLKFVF